MGVILKEIIDTHGNDGVKPHFAEFHKLPKNKEIIGEILNGSRPSIIDKGLKLPRFSKDPLNFLTANTHLSDDWYKFSNRTDINIVVVIFGLLEYLEDSEAFIAKYINIKK